MTSLWKFDEVFLLLIMDDLNSFVDVLWWVRYGKRSDIELVLYARDYLMPKKFINKILDS